MENDTTNSGDVARNGDIHSDAGNIQNEILRIIRSQPTITSQKLAGLLKISPRTAQRYLKILLKSSGIIQRLGASKNGEWIVSENQ
ncbi:MAG: HTH domain-containing protein [Acidobacteriota bacterium]|nr:HTH domain-containing protein [Acidobacteriota bacterium]